MWLHFSPCICLSNFPPSHKKQSPLTNIAKFDIGIEIEKVLQSYEFNGNGWLFRRHWFSCSILKIGASGEEKAAAWFQCYLFCSACSAQWMCPGFLWSTCSVGIDQSTCCPVASQWLGYTQDAAEGLGLGRVSVEGEWEHSGGGKDQKAPDRGVQRLLQWKTMVTQSVRNWVVSVLLLTEQLALFSG